MTRGFSRAARMLLPLILFASAIPVQAQERTPQPDISGTFDDGVSSDAKTGDAERTVVKTANGQIIFNTTRPRYHLYFPDPAKANGAAVVMLPGGAMRMLSVGGGMDDEIAAFLDHGITVMLLEYRTLPQTREQIERASRPRPADAPPVHFPPMEIHNGNANPSPNDARLNSTLAAAVSDAQAALAMLHHHAAQWHIDPDRIGVIGTSAGGGVGFGTVFANVDESKKPDFLISIFGPSLQDAVVPEKAPPLFLVTEADHGPVTDGLLAMFSIWKAAGKKAELHVYEVPNFSMTVNLWGPRLFDWMTERGILPADK